MTKLNYFKAIFVSAVLASGSLVFAETKDTSSVNAAGTKVDTHVENNAGRTLTGATKSTSEETTTVDPKGLGNKVESSHTAKTVVKENGDYNATSKREMANGTDAKKTKSLKTSKHWLDKGKTTTSEETAVVDPEGLGNKTTQKKKEVVQDNGTGKVKHTKTTTVNGKTVSETKLSN